MNDDRIRNDLAQTVVLDSYTDQFDAGATDLPGDIDGVRVGGVNKDPDEAIARALKDEAYIVQEKIPLDIWSEEIPSVQDGRVFLETCQTDFRCLMGPKGLFGFLGRYGGVPTNVGSGGGVQPLAVLCSDMSVKEAAKRINDAVSSIDYDELLKVVDMQNRLALEHSEGMTMLLKLHAGILPRQLLSP